MSSSKRLIMAMALVFGFTLAAAAAQPTAASDGQMLCRGSDIFSNVFASSGRARTNACPVVDCPTGTTSCHVVYAWFTKCEWVWCTTFDRRTPWTIADHATQLSWCQHGKQQYQLQMMVTWTAPATRTVDYWGENESVVNFGGGVSLKRVVRGEAVVGYSGGYRIGVKMETDTGSSGSSVPIAVSNSAGWITLNCP